MSSRREPGLREDLAHAAKRVAEHARLRRRAGVRVVADDEPYECERDGERRGVDEDRAARAEHDEQGAADHVAADLRRLRRDLEQRPRRDIGRRRHGRPDQGAAAAGRDRGEHPEADEQRQQRRHRHAGQGHGRRDDGGERVARVDEPARRHAVDHAREEPAADQVRQEPERERQRGEKRRAGPAVDEDGQGDRGDARAGGRDRLGGEERAELARAERLAVPHALRSGRRAAHRSVGGRELES